MFRATMTSTMPVARTATPAPCTASVVMFSARRNVPPFATLKPIRIAARATSIPNRRKSISAADKAPRSDKRGAAGA